MNSLRKHVRNCTRTSAELTHILFNSAREESSLQQGACQVTGSSTVTKSTSAHLSNHHDGYINGGHKYGYMKMEAEIQYGFHKILLKAQTYSSGYPLWCFSSLCLLWLEFRFLTVQNIHMVTGDLLLQFPSPLETETSLHYVFASSLCSISLNVTMISFLCTFKSFELII